MNKDLGQDNSKWSSFWGNITPLSEIRAWDFYGGRQWVSKYTPRFGKVVEAGCGVGRYVFYLRRLGIDIEGLDFAKELIDALNQQKYTIDQDATFISGDVTAMPYLENTISGYISLGVIEHFIEGPHLALREAYRILRPGGIAIITTPNISFAQYYLKSKRGIKDVIKKLLNYPPRPFFQYEYTPRTLKQFLNKEGFYVSRYEACDLLYSFGQLVGSTPLKLHKKSFPYKASSYLENTVFRSFGAQSITISVKTAPLMYCFISGEFKATPDSLKKFDVPIADEYQNSELAQLFLKRKPVRFAAKYEIDPPLLKSTEKICSYSGEVYWTHPIFEDFGFIKSVSPISLKKPEINIDLCTNYLKPIYRRRDKYKD